MSVELIELAAGALEELTDEVVFVGAAAVAYWLSVSESEYGRPRVTVDADVVSEITTKAAYYRFGDRLRAKGFSEVADSNVICRWLHKESRLIIDVMPSSDRVLGFGGGWQARSIPCAARVKLQTGAEIRIATAEYLLAMKLEAYRDRGRGDVLASHDFEDVILLIASRKQLLTEVSSASEGLRRFVAENLRTILESPRLDYAIEGALVAVDDPRTVAREIVRPRFESLSVVDSD